MYVFNPFTNRFFHIYTAGYISGLDNNDDTPYMAGGTCTKIDWVSCTAWRRHYQRRRWRTSCAAMIATSWCSALPGQGTRRRSVRDALGADRTEIVNVW